MSDTPPLEMADLAAILRREYNNADSYHDQLAKLQYDAFKYYEAQPFGNEINGRSQVILPDVQETIDYMVESVSRTFISGDRIVEFEATEEEDEEIVADATAAIEYIFHRRQDGERIIYDSLLDGLQRKYGVIKTVMETEERVTNERLRGTLEQAAMHLPEDAELGNFEDHGDGTMSADVKHSRTEKVFKDYAIPTAEFRFSPNARHEDEADYLCHVCLKTRSDLVEMGFDRDQVASLPHYSTTATQVQPTESRDLDTWMQRESATPEMQQVLFCEEYARIDLDNDGIAERVKIHRVENFILIDAETGKESVETIDEQPFSVFCPFPRQHRLVGYSLADKVMDIQLARSFAARQLFDGMAFSNMPRPIVDTTAADAQTYEDILTPIPGSPIRVKGGAAAIQPMQMGFDAGKSLTVMEWLTGERESRTGITRLNQGLDADALNKTATGTALMQAMGQQNEEGIARRYASMLSRLFAKKYRLMKREADPIKVKVDGNFKTVDPSQWPDDVNVIVRVGLGSGSKDKRIQYRMAVAPMMAEGFQQGVVSPQNVFHMMDGLVRDMGLGKGDDYWIDPDSPEGQQAMAARAQQPDPHAAQAQAKAQTDQLKIQSDAQVAQQQQQLEAGKAQAQAQVAVQTTQMKIDAQREIAAQKAMTDQDRMQAEAALEMRRQDIEADTKQQVAAMRPGGKLDA